MKRFAQVRFIALGGFLAATSGQVTAQAPGLTRVMVGKADVSVPGREAVVARVDVAPGGKAGRHTHAGDEISSVLEGEATLSLDGQPPRQTKAGESFVVPAGIAHDVHNNSAVATGLAGVYGLEKGKPLATLAP